ncbi:hypothetical protein F8M41_006581 [Gigaspora margarita]|uniref:Uncharacterized protein n=1 Tax=Gigaspora margarita TaxID=4874 RepID=A0A8H4A500_GIGMA|nr:hypothetical protein F8M41_006581 [Gigaspora margarita]
MSDLSLYLIGTCYSCQKCLLCFKESSIYSCGCNQKTKPKASNQSNGKTIRVYSRKYIPNNLSPSQEEFFKQADDCFGYSSNFNQTFNIEKLNTTNTKQSESSLYNNSSNCDSELKFKLFVENENGNILPGKSIMTKLVNFEEFKDLIQQWICKINNNYSIVMSNYSLSYKVEHSRTGAMILQDNDDWKEFLKLYKSIITDKIIYKLYFTKCLLLDCRILIRKSPMSPKAKLYIKKNTTIDTPPVYPIFNISYGQIVQPQFPSQSTDSNNTLSHGMSYAPQPQIIYYPAPVHSANFYGLSGSPNMDNSFTSAIYSSKTVHEFFLELEVINNESGSYTQFKGHLKMKKFH